MENFQNFRYGLSLCFKMVHLLGVKLGNRLIFGVIIQFFVGGSKFRARWNVSMTDSYGHENSYQIAIKSLFWPKCWIASYNTQEKIFAYFYFLRLFMTK
jgi:hypothetical protein